MTCHRDASLRTGVEIFGNQHSLSLASVRVKPCCTNVDEHAAS